MDTTAAALAATVVAAVMGHPWTMLVVACSLLAWDALRWALGRLP